MTSLAMAAPRSVRLQWEELPPLPVGLGGQSVGVLGEELVVAGGSYWEGTPWNQGRKVWSDAIYTLRPGDSRWRVAGKLPEAGGYAATVLQGNAMWCVGGQNEKGISRAVVRVAKTPNGVEATRVSTFPVPVFNAVAVSVRDAAFVVGGQPEPAVAVRDSWSCTKLGEQEWRRLPALPGPARFLAQVAALGDDLFVCGGSDLVADAKPPVRRFLKDAYRFSVKDNRWTRIADVPRPAQAGLAIGIPGAGILLFGGSDGLLAAREAELGDKHPGFCRDVLLYDSASQRWQSAGELPCSLVTTGLAQWAGKIVIAGGEDRPGHRSARVIAARITVQEGKAA